MGRLRSAGAGVFLLLAACSNAQALPPSSHGARTDRVLTESNFGSTVQLRVGQTFELHLPDGWSCCRFWGSRPGVLEEISAAKNRSVVFRAVRPGSQAVTAFDDFQDCSQCEMIPAPVYNGFTAVVTGPGESFDVALSEDDNGKAYLLTPGVRIVVASNQDQLLVSDPGVLRRSPSEDHDALAVLTAEGIGQVTLTGGPVTAIRSPWSRGAPPVVNGRFQLTIVVRQPRSRYDAIGSDIDAGRTFHLAPGQTIAFQLSNASGFGRWTGEGGPLVPLVDPELRSSGATTTLGFLVRFPAGGTILFFEKPICWGQPGCSLVTRTIEVQVAVT